MRFRLLAALAAVVGLSAGLPARSADDKPKVPTLVVRVESVEALTADFKYLAALAGKEEEAKQAEAILKLVTGPKGIEGLDTKKPIGAYLFLGPNGIDSTGAVLIPVADEKAILGILTRLNLKTAKGDDGVYTLESDNIPVPIYFKFANGYAYVTAQSKDVLAADRLLAPEKVFAAGKEAVVSATLNLTAIPKNIRELALGQIELRLAELKEKKGDETKAQQALKEAVIDEVSGLVKSLLEDEAVAELRFTIDRKANELAVEGTLSARAGTPLSKRLADMAKIRSTVAGLTTDDAAVSLSLYGAVPDKVKAAIGPVYDELRELAEKKAPDDNSRKLAKQLLDAVAPTVKDGVLDLAGELRGPSAKDTYTLIVGGRVKDGKEIDKALQAVAAILPAEAAPFVGVNAEKGPGGVGIHKVDVSQFFPPEMQKVFGQNPVWIAIRDDAAFLGVGDQGLQAVKDALAVKPADSRVARGYVSLARLTPLIALEQKEAPEIAKKAFADAKGSDRIGFTVEGGDDLRVRLSAKGGIVRYIALSIEAKNAKDQ